MRCDPKRLSRGEEQGVQCAPLPVRLIEKGLASDRAVIDTAVSNLNIPFELQKVPAG
jgi:hypothetical protein